ncbi:MAG: Ig-like domain-containing protein, partial [Saprospiraceae bacterium]|nr:Ig-like domain-containing protein [Saprospiraceae bacterium]
MQRYLPGLGLLLIFFWGCASKATPPGGPKDETPPRIIIDKSTPNYQLHFDQKSIIITLDEWVELEDAQNQVLISPPLEKRPDIRIKKRSVVFTFHDDEKLRENATYSINFGESIHDITEKNVLKNFIFVFSTGDVLDSLKVEGQIKDAF